MIVEWTPFDYDNKVNTPDPDELVWVKEGDDEVTLGFFDGFTFRLWYGTDDCMVTMWAPVEFPEAPEYVEAPE